MPNRIRLSCPDLLKLSRTDLLGLQNQGMYLQAEKSKREGLDGIEGLEINARAWRDLFFLGTRWQTMPT